MANRIDLIKGINDLDEQKNIAYRERNRCVALIAQMAVQLGLPVGLSDAHEPEEGFVKVLMLDLPSGQVSWHIPNDELHYFEGLPEYDKPWDKHTTERKYFRVVNPGFEKKE